MSPINRTRLVPGLGRVISNVRAGWGVEWPHADSYRSAMPDEATARQCSVASELLIVAEQVAGRYEIEQRDGIEGGIPHDLGQRARAAVTTARGQS